MLGVAALVVEALLGTAALAVVGRRGRRLAPWASGSLRGHLLWSAAVFLLGTAGAAAVGYLLVTPYGMTATSTWQLLLLLGPPYAIAAALLVPRLALRIGALAAAAAAGLSAALLAYAVNAGTEATIAHAAKDGSHPYDAACDPSLSPSVTCTDDGAGRTLVTDRKARTRELYVRHGAVNAVASPHTGASLADARHLVTTLRSPSEHERVALAPPAH